MCFVLSNFNYCPLIWRFSCQQNTHKPEKIQERGLHFVFNDTNSTYEALIKLTFPHLSSAYLEQ